MPYSLGEIQAAHPEVEIGSYPFFRMGKLGASFVIRGIDGDKVAVAAAAFTALRLSGTVAPGTKLEAPRLIDGKIVPSRPVE